MKSKKEEKIDIAEKLSEFCDSFTELQDSLPDLTRLGLTSEQIMLISRPLHELKLKYIQLECDIYDVLRQETRESFEQGYDDGKAVGEIKSRYCKPEPRIWGLV